MIRRDCDKDLSRACICLSRLFRTLGCETLVWAVLVVHKMVNPRLPNVSVGFRDLGHSDGHNKCSINARIVCHPCWDCIAAIRTCSLPLPNPFLKALKAEVVPTRCRNRPLGKLHANGAVEASAEKIEEVVTASIGIGETASAVGSSLIVAVALAHELLASLGLLAIGERSIGLNRSDGGDQVGGGLVGGDCGSDGGGRKREERGAVGAGPLESVAHGLRANREARNVPGGGARVAREGLVGHRRRLDLAHHAYAIAVAREIAVANLRRHG